MTDETPHTAEYDYTRLVQILDAMADETAQDGEREKGYVEGLRDAVGVIRGEHLTCRCRVVGSTRDPYEPHIPAQVEWEQADDCPVHPLPTVQACCCEVSPPEFGGPIPDRECPLHAEPLVTEWGHRYPDGSVIADSSEVVAKSRAAISAVSASRDGREPLILMRRTVSEWTEVSDD